MASDYLGDPKRLYASSVRNLRGAGRKIATEEHPWLVIEMNPPTRTPEGQPNQCPICGKPLVIEPSQPAGDAPCPHCGCLLWFPSTAKLEVTYAFRKLSISDPSIRTKVQAITTIIDRLVEAKQLAEEDREEILSAILKREQLGSTGIGRGVAIPHAKHSPAATFVGALAVFPAGVDFDSVDGEPVHVVCLFVSPKDRPGEHLRILEAIARQLREAK
jgi:PTS system fructose-specific IIA component/PTS system nitrogen regulatory IIA component